MPDTRYPYPKEWYDRVYTRCPLCNSVSRVIHLPAIEAFGLVVRNVYYVIACPTHGDIDMNVLIGVLCPI